MELLSYSDRYPNLLRRYESPFKMLFLYGNVKLLNLLNKNLDRQISFTGSRYIDEYEEKHIIKTLRDIYIKLVPNVVITGGARGCDRLVIDYFDKRGIGNLICVPIITPKIIKEFQDLKSYLLIGIYPCERKIDKEMFLERNKLVAGLSKRLIFLKGGLRSGSMSTANIALKLGNDVYVNSNLLNREGFEGNKYLLGKGFERTFKM